MSSPSETSTTSPLAYDTYELASITLCLREDLNFYIREYGGRPACVIEDQLTSRFYRVGLAEYTFLSLLDGRMTFAGALGKCAAILKADAISEERATSLCQWLVQSGLASTMHSRSVDRLDTAARTAKETRRAGLISLLSQRLPLFCPQGIVDSLNSTIGWLLSAPMIFLWLILISVGVGTIAVDWERFRTASTGIVSRDNWIWLAGTWLTLKLIHETAHALMCTRFGGHVREAGITLMMFVPLPYVDVTSSWRLASKWHRILVSSAGMLAEMALAAIAAIVWSQTQAGMLNQTAFNVMMSAGLTTLVVNANPLMRFDGYYILSDFLEQPNLAAHGQQAILHFGRSWVLGLSSTPPKYPEGHRWITIIYGVAAFLWRILVNVGIVITAEYMLFGAGVALAVGMIFYSVVRPICRLIWFVARGSERHHFSRMRFAVVVAFSSAVIWLGATFLPRFGSEQVSGVVDFSPKTEIRTRVSGFVDQYEVNHGDQVQAGQVIARLRNDEIELKIQELRSDVALSLHRSAVFLTKQEVAAWQVEQENLVALHSRLHELELQIAALTVTCDRDGIILMERQDHIRGAYLSTGQLVATIGSPLNMEIIAAIDQNSHAALSLKNLQSVCVHVEGRGTECFNATLQRIDPQATREMPHPALGAHAGGDLDVRMKVSAEKKNQQTHPYEFLEPRFLVHVSLPQSPDYHLLPGQLVTLALSSDNETLGSHLRRSVENWWNSRTRFGYLEWYRDMASLSR